MFNPSPETFKALIRGQLPYRSASPLVSHLQDCPDWQAVLADARESLLLEEELQREDLQIWEGHWIITHLVGKGKHIHHAQRPSRIASRAIRGSSLEAAG